MKADMAIVSDDAMAAVVAAARLRRAGVMVKTYLSGREKKQRSKAMVDAHTTMTVDEATDFL